MQTCEQTRMSSLDSSVPTPGSLTLVPLTVPSVGSTPLASVTVTTPRQMREPLTAEQMATDYCCHGKFPLLHVIVISLLIGITLLIVGLVQLKPNADSEAKKFFFLGSAAACCGTGLFLMGVRCILRYRFRRNSMLIPRRLIERDDSTFSFCGRAEERDRATDPADSIALLQQRFWWSWWKCCCRSLLPVPFAVSTTRTAERLYNQFALNCSPKLVPALDSSRDMKSSSACAAMPRDGLVASETFDDRFTITLPYDRPLLLFTFINKGQKQSS